MYARTYLAQLRHAERRSARRGEPYPGEMDELHRSADKLATDSQHLATLIEADDTPDDDQINVALGVAKRVRRTSTLLVRQLAELRDNR
jgi:hypothetical protein